MRPGLRDRQRRGPSSSLLLHWHVQGVHASMKYSATQSLQRPWRAPGSARHRIAPTRASGTGDSSGGAGGGANADILARINRAKQYSKTAQPQVTDRPAAAPQQVPILEARVPAPPAAASPASGGGTPAVRGASSAPPPAVAAPEPAQGISGAGSAPATGPEAVLARIKRAKEYKQPATGAREAPVVAAPGPPGAGASAAAAAPPQPVQQQQPGPPQDGGSQTGGEQQAAGWLQSALNQEQQLDPNMRPEMFSLLKEEMMKKQGGEVILGSFVPANRRDRMEGPTADAASEGDNAQPQGASGQAAAAGGTQEAQQQEQEEGGSEYKPKVSTWGVFPRPQNISQAYGGGRNLRPGQALQSEEEAKERETRVKAALSQYRKTVAADLDPADEARARELYQEGSDLFKKGAISLALEKFAAAAELMPKRMQLGGEARLQHAICLDSLGRSQEAYEIYKTIRSHPTAAVAKQANRMLFGFKAQETLKTENISYAPPSQAWANYFDQISRSSWNASYYTSSKDDSSATRQGEASDGWMAVVAAGVMLAPLALLAYRVMLVR